MTPFDVFHGQVTFANAQIYVRATGFDGHSGLRLSGYLYGPHCDYGHMLPAKSPLRDLGPGENPLAVAVLQDPCVWTSEMPVYYKVFAELQDGDQVIASTEQMYGVLAIGTRDRSIRRSGKRWVPRGIDRDSVAAGSLSDWRTAAAVMVVQNPDDTLCREASEVGVFMIAVCEGSDQPIEQIRNLARWPAVAVVVLLDEPADATAIRAAAPNVIFGKMWRSVDASDSKWNDVYFCRADDIAKAAQATTSIPLIAVDSPAKMETPEAARQACADLQRRLAPHGDFAGYIMSKIL